MNTRINNIAIFGVGVIVGAVTSYLLTKKKYEQQIAEEHAEIMGELEKPWPNNAEKKIDQVLEDMKEKDYKEVVKPYSPTASKPDIFDYIKGNKEVKKYIEYAKPVRDVNYNKPATGEPYVISVEEFSEGKENYDKSTIYYYEADETLADENEETITDVIATVGRDSLNAFGVNSGDDDIVYVRNEKIGIDYEVIRIKGSYQEIVLGTPKGTPEDDEQ
jgi:hypothetical protein